MKPKNEAEFVQVQQGPNKFLEHDNLYCKMEYVSDSYFWCHKDCPVYMRTPLIYHPSC